MKNHTKILIAGILALAGSAFAQKQQPNLVVTPKKGASIERVAQAVVSVGKITKKDKLGRYIVQLKPGMDLQQAVAKLQGKVQDVVARPVLAHNADNPNDFSSLTALDSRISEIYAKNPVKGDDDIEGLGLDYLESYRWWLRDRAFPNDEIDGEAYHLARQQRDQMPKADLDLNGTYITGNWQFVGPTNLNVPYRIYWGLPPVNGRVNAIAYNCNATAIYIGAPEGGVWKSTNGGVNWTPLSDKWPQLQVNAIACDPVNPNIVYAGTGDFDGMRSLYGMGIMKSTDGGATWTNYGQAQFGGYAISQILVDPETPSIVTAFSGRGNNKENYIYRSTNGGQTWVNVSSGSPTANWSDAEISGKDANGQRVYWAAGGQFGGMLFVSYDRGATWNYVLVPNGNVENYYQQIEVATSPGGWNWVYITIPDQKKVYYGQYNPDLFSWDFVDITGDFPHSDGSTPDSNWSQGFYDVHLGVFVKDGKDHLVSGLINLQMTHDGVTWTDLAGPIWDENNARTHSDQHAMAVNPLNPDEVLFGNDGGLYKWKPSTNTLTNLNRNLGITQFYHAAFHPTDPNKILGGTQDNATPYSNGNLANWNNVGGGDGGWSNINPLNPNIQYASSQYMNAFLTTDGWANTTRITPPIPEGETRPFIGVFELCNKNPRYLYAGTDHLYRYDQQTNTWTPHVGGYKFTTQEGAYIRAISTAPSDQNRIYVGTTDGQLHTSPDFGATWSRIDNSAAGALPVRSISSISVHPTNPRSILVGLMGTGTPHVYRSNDAGVASPVWTNVSGSGATGVPNSPVSTIERDPADVTNRYFVGTDIGVFMTTNGGSTWANATAPLGLPNVQVSKLKAVPGTGYLMAATFARGMWRISLGAPVQRKLLSMGATPSTVVGGQGVQLRATLDGNAPPGGAAVSLSDNTTAINTPTSLAVPAGTTTGTANATTTPVSSTVTRTVTGVYGGITKTVNITLTAAQSMRAFTVSPTSIVGGTTTTGTITMATAPGTGGVNVTMSTNSSVLQVATPQNVPAGATTKTFDITSSRVSTAATRTVSAAYNGVTKTVSITLYPSPILLSLTLSRTTVQGGTPTVGTVTTQNVAPTGGARVSLATNTSVIVVPSFVTVNAGAKTAQFTANTLYYNGANVTRTITASLAGVSKTANLTITSGPTLANFTVNPTTVKGGLNTTGTVSLNRVAPTGGTSVAITYNSTVLTGPAWVTVPAGSTGTTFTITTKAVTAAATRSVTAKLGLGKTVNITVNP